MRDVGKHIKVLGECYIIEELQQTEGMEAKSRLEIGSKRPRRESDQTSWLQALNIMPTATEQTTTWGLATPGQNPQARMSASIFAYKQRPSYHVRDKSDGKIIAVRNHRRENQLGRQPFRGAELNASVAVAAVRGGTYTSPSTELQQTRLLLRIFGKARH